jgi:hypothetical protein
MGPPAPRKDTALEPGQPPDDGRKEGLELPVDPRDAPPLTANPLTAIDEGPELSSGKPNPSFGRPRSTTHYQEARLAKMNKLAGSKRAIYSCSRARRLLGPEGAGTGDPALRCSPAPVTSIHSLLDETSLIS